MSPLNQPPTAPGRWNAKWIWAAPPAQSAAPVAGHSARKYAALHRQLTLTGSPGSIPARVCADSRYVLWVNGAEVARGPVRGNPRQRRYDVVDLAPHLRDGANTLAALVCWYGEPMPWWAPAPAFASQVRAGGFLLEARLGSELIGTDASWRGRLLTGWGATRPASHTLGRGLEIVDLRELPAGWTAATEIPWAPAVELAANALGEPGRPEPPNNPLGPYGPHPLPALVGSDIALAADGSGGYAAPGVVSGTVTIDLEGPAGAEVRVVSVELPGIDGAPAGPNSPGAVFTLDGTRRTVETFDRYGLQVATVEASPEVRVYAVTVRERLHPVVGGAWFDCSDSLLTQIYRIGRRTVTLCSADAYLDCPTREQRAWTGDAVVHQMVDLATNADWSLARWNPRMSATPRPDGMLPMAVAGDAEFVDFAIIPDWALHWIHSVHNLYRYLGEPDEIRPLLQVAEGVLRWFDPFVDSDGCLVDVVGWVIIDWSSVYTEGVGAALNGLYGRALLEFAEMAHWLGDEGRAGWALAAHARLAHGFERLWDSKRGRYADSLVAGVLRPPASQHGQAAAIVGGLAAPERLGRLVELLTDRERLVQATFAVPHGPAKIGGPDPGGAYLARGHPEPWWDVDRQMVAAQPFFRYVVHDALAQAGAGELLADQCRDWQRVLARSDTSWSETWFGGTVCHGWSSTPTRDLIVRVLGISPAEPGFAIVQVEPHLGDLAWARGSAPCPGGQVQVSVTPTRLHVQSPIPVRYAGRDHPAGTHTWER
ncbi:MAG: alpha-L-rhamnosidase-related protein [Mycobacteriales bacterium]